MGGNLGSTKTWKVTYYPSTPNNGVMGVAFVEADTRHWAMHTFQQLYAGQYFTICKCEELFKQ